MQPHCTDKVEARHRVTGRRTPDSGLQLWAVSHESRAMSQVASGKWQVASDTQAPAIGGDLWKQDARRKTQDARTKTKDAPYARSGPRADC